MNLNLLPPLFTREEFAALDGHQEELLNSLIASQQLKVMGDGLFGKTRQTRFGVLGPSDSDSLEFIYRQYPQSFIGGPGAYNQLGFSHQVAARTNIFTNHTISYTFLHIVINKYSFPINPELRSLYPLLDYILEPYVFTQHRNPDELLTKLLKSAIVGSEEAVKAAISFYPQAVQSKINSLI